jgi:hypothetical protein
MMEIAELNSSRVSNDIGSLEKDNRSIIYVKNEGGRSSRKSC